MSNDEWGNSSVTNVPDTEDGGWDNTANFNEDLSPKGLNWMLLMTELVALPAVVFGVFSLVRRSTDTSIWEMGLIFMLPVATLMIAALLLDSRIERMTPWFSRKAQWVVVLAASVIAFCIGCFGQLAYLGVVYQPQHYIFLVDKSSSMGYTAEDPFGNDTKNQRKTAVLSMLDNLPEDSLVGLVLFNDEIIEPVIELQPLNQSLRARFRTALTMEDEGGTDFYLPFCAALDIVQAEKANKQNKAPTQMILLTDGEASISSDEPYGRDIAQECTANNVSVSCVQMSQSIRSDLQALIDRTDGRVVLGSAASTLFSDLYSVSNIQTADVLRDDSKASLWTGAILLLLTGLVTGAGLSMMFSRQREFRMQYLVSPLMGVAAFAVIHWFAFAPVWVCESTAFSLFGLVCMRMNR